MKRIRIILCCKIFDSIDSFILVTLPYDLDVVSKLNQDEHLNEHLEIKATDRENFVIQRIKDNPYITYDDVSAKLGVSIATVRRIFSALKKKGVIVGYRENKHDKWTLKN